MFAITNNDKMEDLKVCVINYTETPGPRLRKQGDYSGEDFYYKVLRPTMEKCMTEDRRMVLDLSGVAGYPAGFLDEAFGKLTICFGEEVLKERLVIEPGSLFTKHVEMIWKDINEWETERKRKLNINSEKFLNSYLRDKLNPPEDADFCLVFVKYILQNLDIEDCVVSYNREEEVLYTNFLLPSGWDLMVSQFTDENTDAPAVFSIWRGKALLVSDDLPVSEIVDKINQTLANTE